MKDGSGDGRGRGGKKGGTRMHTVDYCETVYFFLKKKNQKNLRAWRGYPVEASTLKALQCTRRIIYLHVPTHYASHPIPDKDSYYLVMVFLGRLE